MDVDKIKELAEETGIGFMYERSHMVTDGDSISFVSSGKLTMFGENLVEFANAIEVHITER